MLTLRLLVVLVHIALAALIIGLPLGLPRLIGQGLNSGHAAALRLAALEAARRGKLAQVAAVLTLLSGVALILLSGGFSQVSTNFHVALGLMLLAIGVGVFLQRPLIVAIVRAAQTDPPETEDVRARLSRLRFGGRAIQLLWLSILFLMLYRF